MIIATRVNVAIEYPVTFLNGRDFSRENALAKATKYL